MGVLLFSVDISTLWWVQIDPMRCKVTPSIDWAVKMRMKMVTAMIIVMVVVKLVVGDDWLLVTKALLVMNRVTGANTMVMYSND